MERGRRFADDHDNLMATELRLGMPGVHEAPRGCKRATPEIAEDSVDLSERIDKSHEPEVHVAKAQVVGWPPIRSYRKNSFQAKKSEPTAAIYVKVSMDGAPYLRKIDLKVYKSYEELREALEDMFKCFSLVDVASTAPPTACGGSNYAVAYEDKDGDWMLVGDVPWRMFISSCKRLRIMKGSEARGLSSSCS